MAGQLKVNGVTLATEDSSVITLENPQIKDSNNNVILDQSGTKPVLKNVEVVNDSSMMFRNRIINGDMRIAQRGTSFSNNNGRVWGVDRFACQAGTNTTTTYSQESDAPSGFINSLKATISSATPSQGSDDQNYILHVVEGANFYDAGFGTSSAKNVTLSFWVKSSIAGTYGLGIANMGSSRTYLSEYEILNANTWEFKTKTFPGETTGTWLTDNGIGIIPLWDLGLGSSWETNEINVWNSNNPKWRKPSHVSLSLTQGATFYLTGVQLEVGNQATPFEHRPYGMELGLCQRYYQVLVNTTFRQYVHNVHRLPVPFRVSMRSAPVITVNHDGSAGPTGGVETGYTTTDSAAIAVSTTAVGLSPGSSGMVDIGSFDIFAETEL